MNRTLWAAALLLALACPNGKKATDAGVPDAGPRQMAEKEPDDQPDRALEISESSVVTASLSADPAHPDEDWYALVSPTLRTADVTVSAIPGVDVKLEVYDVDRNLVLAVNAGGEGQEERIPNLGVNGRVNLRVVAAKKGSGGAYTLTALLGTPEPGLEVEPNDRAVDANPLPLGQPVFGIISHPEDEDWFRIDLAEATDGGAAGAEAAAEGATTEAIAPEASPASEDGGAAVAEGAADAGAAEAEAPSVALKIDVGGVPGVRLEVQVLSAAEAPLFTTRSEEGGSLSLRNVGVRATDQIVYVVVRSAWQGTGKEARRGFDPKERYQLTVSLEEAGANAELEPNDEPAKATPLPDNGFRQGFLSPKTDVDYYVLRPSQPPVLAKLQLSGVDRVDLVLSLVQPPADTGGQEQVLIKSNDGTIKEPEYLNSVSCADACYFKVEGGVRKVGGKWVRDFENSEMPYRLAISTAPDNGTEEREPNDMADRATPIGFGRPIRGTVYPKKDVDYYRLDLSGRPVRTPLKATVIGILKVNVGLYLHRLEEDGRLSLVQTADRAKGEAPETIQYSAEPGIYVFEVRDTRNRESNFQDYYQLSVEEGG